MTVHRGKKGKYLRMFLDFTEDGILQVDMSKYVEGILEEFPEDIRKSSPTPHSDGLFTVKDEEATKLLGEEEACSSIGQLRSSSSYVHEQEETSKRQNHSLPPG